MRIPFLRPALRLLTAHPLLNLLLKERLIRYTLTYFVAFVATGFLGYLFQLVVTRRLSVAQYGEFQSLMALSGILGVVSAALSYVVIAQTAAFARLQDTAATRAFLRWMTSRVLLFLCGLALIFLAASPFIVRALRLTDTYGVYIVASATLWSIVTALTMGVLSGWERFTAVNVASTLGAVLKVAGGLFVVYLIPRAAPLTIALLLATFGTWAAAAWSVRRLLSPHHHSSVSPSSGEKLPVKHLVPSASDWWFVLLFTLGLSALQHLDVLLVKHAGTATLAGHYGALNVVGKLILWANLSVAAVVLPRVCAENRQGHRIDPWTRLVTMGIVGVLSGTVSLVFLAFPQPILKLFIGQLYLSEAKVLWMVGLANSLLSLLVLEANFVFARRDGRGLLALGATAAFMIFMVARFHDNLSNVLSGILVAYAVGYGVILTINLRAPAFPALSARTPDPVAAAEAGVLPIHDHPT